MHALRKNPVTISALRVVRNFVATMSLVFACSVGADTSAHPYAKWAEQLGIDMNISYDGTRVLEMDGNEFEFLERRAPQKMYTEVNMGSMTAGVILREDLGKSFMLMPTMGFYREDSLEDGLLQTSNGMEYSEIEKVGREDVMGHASSKFKTRFSDNTGKGAGFIWVTDTGVPIKMDMIYSSRGEKGQRMTMQFSELHLREQDPAHFEVPSNLQPMGMSNFGQMFNVGAQGQQDAADEVEAADSGDADLEAKQQACLEEAVAAAEKAKAEEKKGKFGRLMGKMAVAVDRLGISKNRNLSRDVYGAQATAASVSAVADELGINEDDVERCREP